MLERPLSGRIKPKCRCPIQSVQFIRQLPVHECGLHHYRPYFGIVRNIKNWMRKCLCFMRLLKNRFICTLQSKAWIISAPYIPYAQMCSYRTDRAAGLCKQDLSQLNYLSQKFWYNFGWFWRISGIIWKMTVLVSTQLQQKQWKKSRRNLRPRKLDLFGSLHFYAFQLGHTILRVSLPRG